MTKKIISWLLCLTLLWGLAGCSSQPSKQESTLVPTEQSSSSVASSIVEQPEKTESEDFNVADVADESVDFSKYEENIQNITNSTNNKTDSSSTQTDAVSGDTASSGNSQKNNQGVCYFTISCAEILDNMDMLAAGREAFVPENGLILATSEVTFESGETVFDVLKRVTKECGIQLEFNYFPIYESMYIEGIGNLYEKDCGSGSGWLYYVNGVRPNYGVSKYVLADQDVVEFHYTCG